MNRKRKILAFCLVLLVLGNYIVYNHAYNFIHFKEEVIQKTIKPENQGFFEKIRTLIFGVQIPKPKNHAFPSYDFSEIYLEGEEKLHSWFMDVENRKGIILLFHGFASSKSDLLPYADEFRKMGYACLLIDFRGNGQSSGNMTSIGYYESKDVQLGYQWVKKKFPKEKIMLFGCSMGAVAIMKALDDDLVSPENVILECPFGTFKNTIDNRFKAMGLPPFILSDILMFHGGLQLGFNPYSHNPIEYAKGIDIPTLVLYGKHDSRVSIQSINTIFKNIEGEKKLIVFPSSKHEVYLNQDKEMWLKEINSFLNKK
jgi:alpha-beta hydrolase superfamily lysophospholipase